MIQMKIINENEPLKMKVNLPSIPSGNGTSNYEILNNKPKINGVTLIGNKTTNDLHLKYDDTEIKQDIEDLGLALDSEETSRINADNNLQSQIDVIKNAEINIENFEQAIKDYVDNTIASAITTTLGGSY